MARCGFCKRWISLLIVAACFVAVAAIPALLGRCGRVRVAGAVSLWQIAFHSAMPIARIIGAAQRPCGKPRHRSVCHKRPCVGFHPSCAQEERCRGAWCLLGRQWGSSGPPAGESGLLLQALPWVVTRHGAGTSQASEQWWRAQWIAAVHGVWHGVVLLLARACASPSAAVPRLPRCPGERQGGAGLLCEISVGLPLRAEPL